MSINSSIVARRESSARSYSRWFTPALERAKGSLVWDVDGREYIDFLAGAGSLNYGHNDQDMKAALLDYVACDGIAHGLDLSTAAKVGFLEAFEQHILAPRSLDYRVQFTGPTGANAVEAAVKLARKVTGRNNVIAFTRGFHGVTAGALAATANSHFRLGSEQGLHGVTRMPYDGYLGEGFDTATLLERLLGDPAGGIDPPAAILIETVQGEGGLNTASVGWLRRIARAARKAGALLIVDDIQAGCGRTGTFFSFEPAQIVPDLVTLSKSLSGYGLPMSVVCIRPEYDQWLPGQHNGTFRGNAHAFVTAAVALQKYWHDESFELQVQRKSKLVRDRLDAIASLLPDARVKGRGMILGIDVGSAELATLIQRSCVERGLIIECCGPRDEVLKSLAPLTTPEDVLHRGLDIVHDAVCQAISSAALAG